MVDPLSGYLPPHVAEGPGRIVLKTLYLIDRLMKSNTVGSWETLAKVTFDVGTLAIELVSEEGYVRTVPCDNLSELHRLAKISIALGEGSNVPMEWRIPTLSDQKS